MSLLNIHANCQGHVSLDSSRRPLERARGAARGRERRHGGCGENVTVEPKTIRYGDHGRLGTLWAARFMVVARHFGGK